MKIVIDAMGGDHAPQATVEGAVQAINEYGIDVILTGDRAQIEKELESKTYDKNKLEIIHTTEIIENEDKPVMAVRRKKDSSMVVALNLVKDKKAKTIIFTCKNDLSKIDLLKENNVDVYISPKDESGVDLNFVIKKLGELKIDSVLVEGGATLNDSLFRKNLVDKVKIFMAPKIIGGKDAPSFVSGMGIESLSDATNLHITNTTMIDNDILIEADVIK